jgi:hypothetical protein
VGKIWSEKCINVVFSLNKFLTLDKSGESDGTGVLLSTSVEVDVDDAVTTVFVGEDGDGGYAGDIGEAGDDKDDGDDGDGIEEGYGGSCSF